MLAIRLPEEIEARLDKFAKRTGRSKTFYAREAILEHPDDLQDLYLAEQVARRLCTGEERSSSLEEVRLGSDDWFKTALQPQDNARPQREGLPA